MKVTTNTFNEDFTPSLYPCLLQRIDSVEGSSDIILAVNDCGDFINGCVLLGEDKLSYYNIGQYIERDFQKKHFKYFNGQLILRN